MDNINTMKLLPVLLGLFCLAAVACGPAATPTSIPDIPRFADGEATAVVKDWVSTKAYLPNPQPQCLFVEEIIRSPEALHQKGELNQKSKF
jgi:hypothetical protein